MKPPFSSLALLSLLLVTACNKGDPLPGGYAISTHLRSVKPLNAA